MTSSEGLSDLECLHQKRPKSGANVTLRSLWQTTAPHRRDRNSVLVRYSHLLTRLHRVENLHSATLSSTRPLRSRLPHFGDKPLSVQLLEVPVSWSPRSKVPDELERVSCTRRPIRVKIFYSLYDSFHFLHSAKPPLSSPDHQHSG